MSLCKSERLHAVSASKCTNRLEVVLRPDQLPSLQRSLRPLRGKGEKGREGDEREDRPTGAYMWTVPSILQMVTGQLTDVAGSSCSFKYMIMWT